VPKAPLIVLIALCCLFVLEGFGLALLLLCQKPSTLKDIQARLGVFGLVTTVFEEGRRSGKHAKKVEEFFEEYDGQGNSLEVGMEMTDSGQRILAARRRNVQ
jgi:hypothetical protein